MVDPDGSINGGEDRVVRHVMIIGAGIAGLILAMGLRKYDYDVTVLERTPELREVGAGIQLPANSCKILSKLGVLDEIARCSIQPRDVLIRSYRGHQLYCQNLEPAVQETYGFPHLLIHRADLRKILYDATLAVGAKVRLGASVASVDVANATVVLEDGERCSADLIVGADGEHSICRETLLGRKDPPYSSGDVVVRVAVPMSTMRANPRLRELVEPPRVHAWYGPGSHAVCYPLRSDGVFNVVFTMLEKDGEVQLGPQPADIEEVRGSCSSWDPLLQEILAQTDTALQWTLLQTNEIAKWHDEAGNMVLIGDSVHATLPYLAQGAAIAIESAHFLALLLSHRPRRSHLPSLLSAFQNARFDRVIQVRQRSKHMHDMCQMEDGPEQLERDRMFVEDEPMEGFPNPWADPTWQNFMWGYNGEQAAEKCWNRWKLQG